VQSPLIVFIFTMFFCGERGVLEAGQFERRQIAKGWDI